MQAAQLDRMNRPKDFDQDEDGYGPERDDERRLRAPTVVEEFPVEALDLKREEEDIRELERKKRGLEDRVSGMERDLGGLLR